MYAGNLRSSVDVENYLFYWLFPSQEDSERPLIVYLSDSTGPASLDALFSGVGPLTVEFDNTENSHNFRIKYELQRSWTSFADVLFL